MSSISNFVYIFSELLDKGIDALHRISDIETGRATDYELVDAKGYLNQVIMEIDNLRNKAER
jgi:hypothetical protein